MKTRAAGYAVILVFSLLTLSWAEAEAPSDPLSGPATWRPPQWSELRTQVLGWLESSGADAETRQRAVARWPDTEPEGISDRLEYLVETFALVDARVAELRAAVGGDSTPLVMPPVDWLAGAEAGILASNCRLLLGRWAVQQQLYDEAATHLDPLTTDDVADPAALLFYQAVTRQRLLQKKAALQSLGRLLQGEQYAPRRYLAVARLMRSDLEGLEDDSLDHIARRMDDIRRRLQLGRADQEVQQIEAGVIESLDKLIEEAKNQQQQQTQSGMPSGSQRSQPAPDSRILPGRGPGDVTKKDIGEGSGWGNLPPKEREAALQQIGREFPAHYRDVVEQYFRRLAGAEKERE